MPQETDDKKASLEPVQEELDIAARWLNIFAGDSLLGKVFKIVALTFSMFHLYTGFFGILSGMRQRVVHLMFALTLIFLGGAASRAQKKSIWGIFYNLVFVMLAICSCVWYLTQEFALVSWRMGIVYPTDVILGIGLILLILEAARRTVGWSLPICALGALLYACFGSHLPGVMQHPGFSLKRIINQCYLTGEGIWGAPMAVSATYLIVYVLFGAFLGGSGAGRAFSDLAFAVVGRFRGGAAKLAVVSSALFGTISGSATANVMVTGAVTIPLMKRTGYRDYMAAATEATAATGGQLMPPVMGAAAFLMVEMTGTPYGAIANAAIVPALLYYLGVMAMVDLEAARMGIKGLPPSQLPTWMGALRGFWLPFVPMMALIYFLIVADLSPTKAGVWAVLISFGIWFLSSTARITLSRLLAALESGAKAVLPVVASVGCSGIIIGVISLTGLGIKISAWVLELAGGNLFIVLVITMVIGLFLGTGLPTVAAYLLLAVLVAPSMVKLGVPLLAAHMFIFYFGVLACLTPPDAISAYAAAGLAGSDPWLTGWVSTKLALVGFIVPFMFVYQPEMLVGSIWVRIQAGITGAAGVVGLAASLYGILFTRLSWLERAVLLVSAFALLYPETYTDVFGAILILTVGIRNYLKRRRTEPVVGLQTNPGAIRDSLK